MRINKHDTQGTKPLLNKGELGYDDYAAGGDTGRIYVGTGTENIALAERLEANMMAKAQFNALSEERKANRAGSGFEEWGKHFADNSVVINEGMWTASTYQNKFVLGRNASGAGVSKTTYPVININGVLQKILYTNTSSINNAEILLPTAPNIYPHDTVLTAEQIASGVIKHADASNSGLIVNGKFDTDTSGWTATNGATLSIDTGRLKVSQGLSDYSVATQSIQTVIGKTYTVEFSVGDGSSAAAAIYVRTSATLGNIAQKSAPIEGRYTVDFTATTTTTFICAGSGSSSDNIFFLFDNIAVYPADAISRSDLVFPESYHEDIAEKGFGYPFGNIQYLGGNTDGLTGIANGAFTGFETYSLFGFVN